MNDYIGLEEYGTKLQTKIGSATPETLPHALREWLLGWISDKLFTFIWTILIFMVFLFVFYGAFLYFTAYGDENKAEQGKKSITYALVGLIIGAAAMGIATFTRNIIMSRDAYSEMLKVNTTAPSAPSGTGGTGSSSGITH